MIIVRLTGLFLAVGDTGSAIRPNSSSGKRSAPRAFRGFFELNEPHVNLVNPVDVLREDGSIRIFLNRRFVVPSPQVSNDLIELVDFGMHDTQVADEPNFFDIKPAAFDGLFRLPGFHRRSGQMPSL
jgi:hypothetical protein